MLSIPQMKVDGNADTTHLAIFLRSQNSYNEQDIINDVARFTRIRRDAVSVVDPSDIGQQTILRYVAQTRSFLPRISGMESEIKTSFAWFDAFMGLKKEAHSNFYFDLAAFLWNLGAFESVRGSKVDRSTDEGIRIASRHFQQAAGYFDYIQEHILPKLVNCTLPCLTVDCLHMVKQLLLAQAQLCFYEKAVRDKKKDSMKSNIIAKLSMQTSLFYAAASVACRAPSLTMVVDISWFAVSDFQAKCFLGAAEYWQAVASKEAALQKGTGYGEEVARYNRAEQHVRTALEMGRKFNLTASSLPAVAESLLNVIVNNRTTAIHDLSTVYMESVPNESSLTEVTPVAMVKPSGLPDLSTLLTDSADTALFQYVLPKAIIEANRRFYEEINGLYAQASAQVVNATDMGKTTLSSVGLPGSLEAVKPENPLPEVLWTKIEKAKAAGGLERLRSLLDDLKSGARRALNSMGTIEDTLDREERQDDSFRSRYAHFNGTRSAVMGQDIRVNIHKLREAYANAQRNDDALTQDIFSPATINSLARLSQTREQIEQLFPSATAVSGSVDLLDLGADQHAAHTGIATNLSPTGQILEEKLEVLAGLFETRQLSLEGLKQLTNVDLLQQIQRAMDAGTDVFVLHNKYSQEARQLAEQINQSVAQQDALMTEILRLNEIFVKSKDNDPLAKARNEVIQSLEQSVVKYFSLQGQISAGLTFYSNLQSKVTTLQQSADDLAYTQQWQRQEFEQSDLDLHNRSNQDQLDREMALKLSNELNVSSGVASPSQGPSALTYSSGYGALPSFTSSPAPAPAAAAAPYGAPPQAHAATSAAAPAPYHSTAHTPGQNGGLVYGTPVQGPPSHAAPQPYAAPQSYAAPAPAPAAPATASNYYPGVPAVQHAPPAQTAPAPAAAPTSGYQYNQNSYAVPTPQYHQPPQQQQQYQQPTYAPQYPGVVSPPPAGGVNPGYHHPAPAPAPAPSVSELQPKIERLCEMGFSRAHVEQALVSSGGNEELALSMLLSVTSSDAAAPAPPAAPPAKPAKSGGFFTWGKK